MVGNDFEHQLVEALQPIRFFALAQALHVVMDSGVYDTFDAQPGLDTATIAERHGLDVERLQALCYYLANEGYIIEDGGWRLTDKARTLAPFRPWYTLGRGATEDGQQSHRANRAREAYWNLLGINPALGEPSHSLGVRGVVWKWIARGSCRLRSLEGWSRH
jgi:hypothetical protein